MKKTCLFDGFVKVLRSISWFYLCCILYRVNKDNHYACKLFQKPEKKFVERDYFRSVFFAGIENVST